MIRNAITPHGVVYRQEVTPSDCGSVRDIVLSSGFFSKEEVEVAVELVQERLQKGIRSGYHFLFAELPGKVIGYSCFGPIACTRSSYDLYWIAVHEDYRGLGVGRGLLAGTERLIGARLGSRIYVETSSRDQYEPTRSFYRHCGYRQDAILRDFYAPGDHKVIYLKIGES